MSFKSADGYRRFFQDASTDATLTASSGDTTLITARSTSHTIWVQRIIAYITTDAAQSWAFEDSTTGKKIAEVTSSPGDETRWDFDFGDEGIDLTIGENLVLNASAAGLAGHVKVYAYQKLSAAMAAGTTN